MHSPDLWDFLQKKPQKQLEEKWSGVEFNESRILNFTGPYSNKIIYNIV
jgi:hypothetical protein